FKAPNTPSYAEYNEEKRLDIRMKGMSGFKMWLLGIDWGHLDSHIGGVGEFGGSLFNVKIKVSSAMTGVVPAWRIKELLDATEMAMRRESINQHLLERTQPNEGGTEANARAVHPRARTRPAG